MYASHWFEIELPRHRPGQRWSKLMDRWHSQHYASSC